MQKYMKLHIMASKVQHKLIIKDQQKEKLLYQDELEYEKLVSNEKLIKRSQLLMLYVVLIKI